MLKTMKEVAIFFKDRNNSGIKPGLDRVHYLLERTGHPEKDLFAIHVAGTNGKGSTIQFLHDALVANQYKVGVFTSPSFTGVRGHILLNGQEVKEEDFLTYMNQLLPKIQELDQQQNAPTEFEILTVLAILYFRHHADIVLMEVGMGGKEDTTNVIIPAISVITNVGKDHMNFLGDTIEEITSHKAGIIKREKPVVVGNVCHKSSKIIRTIAKEHAAQVYQLYEDFNIKGKNIKNTYEWVFPRETSVDFSLQIEGKYQVENAAVALMVLFCLDNLGKRVDWQLVTSSIKMTTLRGRFEKISEKPMIILDSAHNVAGFDAFLKTVQELYGPKRKHLLFAGFKDKQLTEMLEQITDQFTTVTLTTFDHERAAPIEVMKQYGKKYKFQITDHWENKVLEIVSDQSFNDVYFITGSLHFITLVRPFILQQKNKHYD